MKTYTNSVLDSDSELQNRTAQRNSEKLHRIDFRQRFYNRGLPTARVLDILYHKARVFGNCVRWLASGFPFSADHFRLVQETGLDGERLAQERQQAEEARKLAEAAQAKLFARRRPKRTSRLM